jgi:Na+/phosphate symporter
MKDSGTARTAEELRQAIQQMCAETVEMLRLAREGFRRHDAVALETAARQGKVVHRREKELTDHVVSHWHAFPEDVRDLLFIPTHLERIGDNVENLVRCIEMIRQEGIPFTDRAVNEISSLFEKGIELLECVRDLIPTRNRILMRYVVKNGEEFQALASDYALAHQERLIKGLCLPKASSSFLAILDYLKEIEWHTRQIVQKMTAKG